MGGSHHKVEHNRATSIYSQGVGVAAQLLLLLSGVAEMPASFVLYKSHLKTLSSGHCIKSGTHWDTPCWLFIARSIRIRVLGRMCCARAHSEYARNLPKPGNGESK